MIPPSIHLTLRRKLQQIKVQHPKEYQTPLTDDLVDANSKVPTTPLGKCISKRFHNRIYVGTITGAYTDDNFQPLWHVQYDDGDSEDLELNKVRDGIDFHKIYPKEHCFNRDTQTTPPTPDYTTADVAPVVPDDNPHVLTTLTGPATEKRLAQYFDTTTGLQ